MLTIEEIKKKAVPIAKNFGRKNFVIIFSSRAYNEVKIKIQNKFTK